MKKVACIGDSITWGFTLLRPWKQSYPVLLGEMLGDDYTVRNFGCNDAAARYDADTPYVRRKVYRDSIAWNPDIVLLMLGTNDTKSQNWNQEIFERDYLRITESYLNLPSHPRVILIAPIRIFRSLNMPLITPQSEPLESGVRPTIHRIADRLNLEQVDLYDLFSDTTYCKDGLHPQATGAKMLAEAIYSRINW